MGGSAGAFEPRSPFMSVNSAWITRFLPCARSPALDHCVALAHLGDALCPEALVSRNDGESRPQAVRASGPSVRLPQGRQEKASVPRVGLVRKNWAILCRVPAPDFCEQRFRLRFGRNEVQ
jgi:hypothetical protein